MRDRLRAAPARRRTGCLFLLGLVLATAGGRAVAAPEHFTADDPLGRDLVRWTIDAPLERIGGSTGAVRGEITVDRENLRAAGTTARFVVDVAGFATGIELRDRHLREDFLAVGRFPQAVFTLERVTGASADSLRPDVPTELTVTGTLELRGVKRPLTVPIQLLYMRAAPPAAPPHLPAKPGNLLRLTAEFEVLLADFGIPRRGIILQVSDTAQVSVSVLATDAAPDELARARAEAEASVRREMAPAEAQRGEGGS